jgi:hypothetical protein
LTLQSFVDDLLVQTGNIEDPLVVVEPNLLSRLPVQQIEVDLVLTQLAHIGGRKLDTMSLQHWRNSFSTTLGFRERRGAAREQARCVANRENQQKRADIEAVQHSYVVALPKESLAYPRCRA